MLRASRIFGQNRICSIAATRKSSVSGSPSTVTVGRRVSEKSRPVKRSTHALARLYGAVGRLARTETAMAGWVKP